MLIGRTDDPQNPCRVAAFEVTDPFGCGSRNPSGPAVIVPRQIGRTHDRFSHQIRFFSQTPLHSKGRPHTPYGVSYDPAWRKRAGVNLNPRKLGKVANDDQADWREAWALFPGSVAYIWHASLHTSEVKESLEVSGFNMRAQIIWAKEIGRASCRERV